ncbi:MAG: YrdB family protein [Actinomycetota bacterium]
MNGLRGAVLRVRFLCEIGMLAALAYWGFEVGDGALGLVLGLGAPLVAIAIWGAFVAPKARFPVALSTRLVLEVLLFGATAASLAALGLWATA